MARSQTVAVVASPTPDAQAAAAALSRRYATVDPEKAEVVVALGGDGLMLQTLHRFMGQAKPIYGMNKGTVGFLMNDYRDDDLIERLAAAQRSVVHPLQMTVRDVRGRTHAAQAVNDLVAAVRRAHS